MHANSPSIQSHTNPGDEDTPTALNPTGTLLSKEEGDALPTGHPQAQSAARHRGFRLPNKTHRFNVDMHNYLISVPLCETIILEHEPHVLDRMNFQQNQTPVRVLSIEFWNRTIPVSNIGAR